MISTEVQRTLVKSPPELWSELSDEAALARHLSGLGSVRIVGRTAEERIDWEAEDARGSIRIKPSGWGTRVTLTLERDGDAAADRPADQEHGQPVAGPGTRAGAAETEADSDEAAGSTQPDAVGEAAVKAPRADATAPTPEERHAADPAPAPTPAPEKRHAADLAPAPTPEERRAPDLAPASERSVDADAATAPLATRESTTTPDPEAATATEATSEPNGDAKGGASEVPVTTASAEAPAPASEARVPRRRFFERVISRWRHLITSTATLPEAPEAVPGATAVPPTGVPTPSVPANAETPVPAVQTASTKEPFARAETTAQPSTARPSAPAKTTPQPPEPANASPAPAASATAATPTPATRAGSGPQAAPAIAAVMSPTPATRAASELPAGTARGNRTDAEQRTSPAKDIAAELRAAEEAPEDGDTAVLMAVLDSLGAAHHRPFSRS